MITNERQKTTHSSQFLDQRARSPSGQLEPLPLSRLSDRCQLSFPTFDGAAVTDGNAPIPDVPALATERRFDPFRTSAAVV
jgi:hypothetical protein